MKKKTNPSNHFEAGLDIFAWIRIVLSPLLISAIPAALVYFSTLNLAGFMGATIILLAGLIIGIIRANRIQKKQGAQQFFSRISASPDLDPKTKIKENKDSRKI